MNTVQLQRAILWAFLATLIALIGVTTVAWVRRPRTASPAAARRRPPPVLANEPDGSVYDITLKIDDLKTQLSESEARVVTQQKLLEEMRRERTTLERRMEELAGQIKELRDQFERAQQERPTKPEQPAPEGPPPTTTPPGGPVTTPPPPSPAAPPP